MANLEIGSKVKWIKKMAAVPHPEGKTDRHGEVLPVFRDKEYEGTIVSSSHDNRYVIRPDHTIEKCPSDMPSYYDVVVKEKEISLV